MPGKITSKAQQGLFAAHCAGKKTALSDSMSQEKACDMLHEEKGRLRGLPAKVAVGKNSPCLKHCPPDCKDSSKGRCKEHCPASCPGWHDESKETPEEEAAETPKREAAEKKAGVEQDYAKLNKGKRSNRYVKDLKGLGSFIDRVKGKQ